ncbi:hypothetical protein RB23_05535, partial [Francisella tularensis subsp. holarctica]
MSKKIFKLLSISIIFSIYQQTFSNTITASTFELK